MLKFHFAGIISVRSTHLWKKRRIRVRSRTRIRSRIREAQKHTDLGILTWYVSLAPVLAAEAADPAGDDHHERGGDGAHNQQQLQVDLAVLPGEPGVAAARHLYAARGIELSNTVNESFCIRVSRSDIYLRLRCLNYLRRTCDKKFSISVILFL
jgi:hypothetical protein